MIVDSFKKYIFLLFVALGFNLLTVNIAFSQSNFFNEACYIARYPDVQTGWINNGGKAIDHWTQHGQYENRIPGCNGSAPTPSAPQSSSAFNEACYIARYPDVQTGWINNGGKAIDHWTQHGQYENRIPGCNGSVPTPSAPSPTLPIAPVSSSATSITGPGANPVTISINPAQTAGAVSSLIWNGLEFVNNYDKGRQIQTAVQFDGYAECNNPTEAGSSSDGRRSSSSSRLVGLQKNSPSSLSTKTQMAYWAWNKTTGACVKGRDPRVNSSVSNTFIEKIITIGALDDPQIIDYSLKISHASGDATSSIVYEILTGYLTSDFSRFFFVSKSNNSLNEYGSASLVDISGNGFPPGSYLGRAQNKKQFDPVIMSTPSGSYAMGVYMPSKQITQCKSSFGYGLFHFNLGGSGPNGAGTNKWNLAAYDSVKNPCIVNNSRSFKVYLVVGSLAQVHAKLTSVMKKAP
jgi:hypothetical protein